MFVTSGVKGPYRTRARAAFISFIVQGRPVVALRTPNDLPPPIADELSTRLIKAHGNEKLFYWARIVNLFSIATKERWAGRRACIDLFSSFGVNHDEAEKLSWGSALLALQVGLPFDTYVFGDRDPSATRVLKERIQRLRISGAEIFDIALDDAPSEIFGRAHEIKAAKTNGPKITILTGDANDAPLVVRQLLPGFPGQRVILSFLDPPGAHFKWNALCDLTLHERMDLLILFPEDMDIERNLTDTERLDAYFGTTDWRALRNAPGNRGQALRNLYETRLAKLLDYKIGEIKVVRSRIGAPIYKLIFASKKPLGLKLWNEGCRQNPYGQDALYLGSEF
jgi:three-Cys-motif partner protein